MEKSEFKVYVDTWAVVAAELARAEEVYRIAHGQVLIASQGKNEAARKADADVATVQERVSRDALRIQEQAALHMVQFAKARAGVAP